MNKYNLIGFAIFMTICILIFLYQIDKTIKKTEEIRKRYPLIEIEDSLNSVVHKLPVFEGFLNNSLCAHIVLVSGKKLTICSRPTNRYSKPGEGHKGIYDFIKSGDKLLKHTGSDTVFIVRETNSEKLKLFFILSDSFKKGK